jgi:ribose 5-phosphate isomerase A
MLGSIGDTDLDKVKMNGNRSETMNNKKMVAEAAVELVEDGMTVGLGTGSTAYWAIVKLGERVKEGLKIRAIATSNESDSLAREQGIPIVSFSDIDKIDITIDGADEVDQNLNLIKGGGGALLREKIIAMASVKLIVIVDETKLVKQLGNFPLPVEVIPFGVENTREKLEKLGCRTEVRRADQHDRFKTDNGNYIVDCKFRGIEDPERLSRDLNSIPGVVENGLFIGVAQKVFVGYQNGKVELLVR